MQNHNRNKIIIQDDEGHTAEFVLNGNEVTIGRYEGNHINLIMRNVSRKHARIFKHQGRLYIEDLKSYNGIKIDGQPVNGIAQLKPGSVVEIGDYKILLEETDNIEQIKENTSPYIIINRISQQEELPDTEKTPIELKTDHDHSELVPKIIVRNGPMMGRAFELTKREVILGSSADADITIADNTLKPLHIRFTWNGVTYEVTDLTGEGDLTVNGKETYSTALSDGDFITIGNTRLCYNPTDETTIIEQREVETFTTDKGQTILATDSQAAVQKRKITKHVRIGIGAGVVLLLIVVIIWMLGNEGSKKVAVKSTPSIKKKSDKAIDKMMILSKVHNFMKEKRWEDSIALLKKLQKKGLTDENIQSLIDQAKKEFEVQKSMKHAKVAEQMSDWDEALKTYNSIPQDSVYYKEAVAGFTRAKKNFIKEHLKEAESALNSGDLNSAEEHYQKVLDIEGDNETALAGLRRIMMLRKKQKKTTPSQKASENKKIVTATDRKNLKTKSEKPEINTYEEAKRLNNLAVEAIRSGELKKAVKLLKRAIKLEPKFAILYRTLGVAYANSGDMDSGAKAYEMYIKLAPNAKDAPQVKKILEQYYRSK